jgi:hypothetical protein
VEGQSIYKNKTIINKKTIFSNNKLQYNIKHSIIKENYTRKVKIDTRTLQRDNEKMFSQIMKLYNTVNIENIKPNNKIRVKTQKIKPINEYAVLPLISNGNMLRVALMYNPNQAIYTLVNFINKLKHNGVNVSVPCLGTPLIKAFNNINYNNLTYGDIININKMIKSLTSITRGSLKDTNKFLFENKNISHKMIKTYLSKSQNPMYTVKQIMETRNGQLFDRMVCCQHCDTYNVVSAYSAASIYRKLMSEEGIQDMLCGFCYNRLDASVGDKFGTTLEVSVDDKLFIGNDNTDMFFSMSYEEFYESQDNTRRNDILRHDMAIVKDHIKEIGYNIVYTSFAANTLHINELRNEIPGVRVKRSAMIPESAPLLFLEWGMCLSTIIKFDKHYSVIGGINIINNNKNISYINCYHDVNHNDNVNGQVIIGPLALQYEIDMHDGMISILPTLTNSEYIDSAIQYTYDISSQNKKLYMKGRNAGYAILDENVPLVSSNKIVRESIIYKRHPILRTNNMMISVWRACDSTDVMSYNLYKTTETIESNYAILWAFGVRHKYSVTINKEILQKVLLFNCNGDQSFSAIRDYVCRVSLSRYVLGDKVRSKYTLSMHEILAYSEYGYIAGCKMRSNSLINLMISEYLKYVPRSIIQKVIDTSIGLSGGNVQIYQRSTIERLRNFVHSGLPNMRSSRISLSKYKDWTSIQFKNTYTKYGTYKNININSRQCYHHIEKCAHTGNDKCYCCGANCTGKLCTCCCITTDKHDDTQDTFKAVTQPKKLQPHKVKNYDDIPNNLKLLLTNKYNPIKYVNKDMYLTDIVMHNSLILVNDLTTIPNDGHDNLCGYLSIANLTTLDSAQFAILCEGNYPLERDALIRGVSKLGYNTIIYQRDETDNNLYRGTLNVHDYNAKIIEILYTGPNGIDVVIGHYERVRQRSEPTLLSHMLTEIDIDWLILKGCKNMETKYDVIQFLEDRLKCTVMDKLREPVYNNNTLTFTFDKLYSDVVNDQLLQPIIKCINTDVEPTTLSIFNHYNNENLQIIPDDLREYIRYTCSNITYDYMRARYFSKNDHTREVDMYYSCKSKYVNSTISKIKNNGNIKTGDYIVLTTANSTLYATQVARHDDDLYYYTVKGDVIGYHTIKTSTSSLMFSLHNALNSNADGTTLRQNLNDATVILGYPGAGKTNSIPKHINGKTLLMCQTTELREYLSKTYGDICYKVCSIEQFKKGTPIIDVDTVIIDECTLLQTSDILRLTNIRCKLVLLGDENQIGGVEFTGRSVFSDVNSILKYVNNNNKTILKWVYRFGGAVFRLFQKVIPDAICKCDYDSELIIENQQLLNSDIKSLVNKYAPDIILADGNPTRNYCYEKLGQVTSIRKVHGFQGNAADTVMIICREVRIGKYEGLSNKRRFISAITRARKKLIWVHLYTSKPIKCPTEILPVSINNDNNCTSNVNMDMTVLQVLSSPVDTRNQIKQLIMNMPMVSEVQIATDYTLIRVNVGLLPIQIKLDTEGRIIGKVPQKIQDDINTALSKKIGFYLNSTKTVDISKVHQVVGFKNNGKIIKIIHSLHSLSKGIGKIILKDDNGKLIDIYTSITYNIYCSMEVKIGDAQLLQVIPSSYQPFSYQIITNEHTHKSRLCMCIAELADSCDYSGNEEFVNMSSDIPYSIIQALVFLTSLASSLVSENNTVEENAIVNNIYEKLLVHQSESPVFKILLGNIYVNTDTIACIEFVLQWCEQLHISYDDIKFVFKDKTTCVKSLLTFMDNGIIEEISRLLPKSITGIEDLKLSIDYHKKIQSTVFKEYIKGCEMVKVVETVDNTDSIYTHTSNVNKIKSIINAYDYKCRTRVYTEHIPINATQELIENICINIANFNRGITAYSGSWPALVKVKNATFNILPPQNDIAHNYRLSNQQQNRDNFEKVDTLCIGYAMSRMSLHELNNIQTEYTEIIGAICIHDKPSDLVVVNKSKTNNHWYTENEIYINEMFDKLNDLSVLLDITNTEYIVEIKCVIDAFTIVSIRKQHISNPLQIHNICNDEMCILTYPSVVLNDDNKPEIIKERVIVPRKFVARISARSLMSDCTYNILMEYVRSSLTTVLINNYSIKEKNTLDGSENYIKAANVIYITSKMLLNGCTSNMLPTSKHAYILYPTLYALLNEANRYASEYINDKLLNNDTLPGILNIIISNTSSIVDQRWSYVMDYDIPSVGTCTEVTTLNNSYNDETLFNYNEHTSYSKFERNVQSLLMGTVPTILCYGNQEHIDYIVDLSKLLTNNNMPHNIVIATNNNIDISSRVQHIDEDKMQGSITYYTDNVDIHTFVESINTECNCKVIITDYMAYYYFNLYLEIVQINDALSRILSNIVIYHVTPHLCNYISSIMNTEIISNIHPSVCDNKCTNINGILYCVQNHSEEEPNINIIYLPNHSDCLNSESDTNINDIDVKLYDNGNEYITNNYSKARTINALNEIDIMQLNYIYTLPYDIVMVILLNTNAKIRIINPMYTNDNSDFSLKYNYDKLIQSNIMDTEGDIDVNIAKNNIIFKTSQTTINELTSILYNNKNNNYAIMCIGSLGDTSLINRCIKPVLRDNVKLDVIVTADYADVKYDNVTYHSIEVYDEDIRNAIIEQDNIEHMRQSLERRASLINNKLRELKPLNIITPDWLDIGNIDFPCNITRIHTYIHSKRCMPNDEIRHGRGTTKHVLLTSETLCSLHENCTCIDRTVGINSILNIKRSERKNQMLVYISESCIQALDKKFVEVIKLLNIPTTIVCSERTSVARYSGLSNCEVKYNLNIRQNLSAYTLYMNHGGMGAIQDGMLCGTYQIIQPIFGDQPNNCEYIQSIDYGTHIDNILNGTISTHDILNKKLNIRPIITKPELTVHNNIRNLIFKLPDIIDENMASNDYSAHISELSAINIVSDVEVLHDPNNNDGNCINHVINKYKEIYNINIDTDTPINNWGRDYDTIISTSILLNAPLIYSTPDGDNYTLHNENNTRSAINISIIGQVPSLHSILTRPKRYEVVCNVQAYASTMDNSVKFNIIAAANNIINSKKINTFDYDKLEKVCATNYKHYCSFNNIRTLMNYGRAKVFMHDLVQYNCKNECIIYTCDEYAFTGALCMVYCTNSVVICGVMIRYDDKCYAVTKCIPKTSSVISVIVIKSSVNDKNLYRKIKVYDTAAIDITTRNYCSKSGIEVDSSIYTTGTHTCCLVYNYDNYIHHKNNPIQLWTIPMHKIKFLGEQLSDKQVKMIQDTNDLSIRYIYYNGNFCKCYRVDVNMLHNLSTCIQTDIPHIVLNNEIIVHHNDSDMMDKLIKYGCISDTAGITYDHNSNLDFINVKITMQELLDKIIRIHPFKNEQNYWKENNRLYEILRSICKCNDINEIVICRTRNMAIEIRDQHMMRSPTDCIWSLRSPINGMYLSYYNMIIVINCIAGNRSTNNENEIKYMFGKPNGIQINVNNIPFDNRVAHLKIKSMTAVDELGGSGCTRVRNIKLGPDDAREMSYNTLTDHKSSIVITDALPFSFSYINEQSDLADRQNIYAPTHKSMHLTYKETSRKTLYDDIKYELVKNVGVSQHADTKRDLILLNNITGRLGGRVDYANPINFTSSNVQNEIHGIMSTYFTNNKLLQLYQDDENMITFDYKDTYEWFKEHPNGDIKMEELQDWLKENMETDSLTHVKIFTKVENLVKWDEDFTDKEQIKSRTIQAHSYVTSALLSPLFMKVKERLKSLLKKKFMYADGKTVNECTEWLRNFEQCEYYFDTDLIKQDRQTTKYNIDVEYGIYQLLGLSPEAINIYRASHGQWTFSYNYGKGMCEEQRLSGQATTALGNVINNMLSHWRFVSDNYSSIIFCIMLGDDICMGTSRRLSTDKLKRDLKFLYNMLSKCRWDKDSGNFCRWIITYSDEGYIMSPDYVRLYFKLCKLPYGGKISEEEIDGRIRSYLSILPDVYELESLRKQYNSSCVLKHIEYYDSICAVSVHYNIDTEAVESYIQGIINIMSNVTLYPVRTKIWK